MADVKSPDGPSASNSPVPNDLNDANPNGNGVNGANKRKRVGGNSARGVANLTPQQLERKRANDREAQRAIRERTKQQIDRLNDKIRELESAQPYRDLQAVISQKDAIEAENVDIKRQLAQFINVFRTYMPGAHGLEGLAELPSFYILFILTKTDLAAAAERNNGPYHLSDQHHPSSGPPPDSQNYPLPLIQDRASPHLSDGAGSPASTGARSRQYPNASTTRQPRRTWPPPQSSYESNSRNIHPELAYPHNDERLNVEFILDNNRPHSKPATVVSPTLQSAQTSPRQFVPSSRKGEATCPLDAILLDAVAERQRLAATGASSETVVGPLYPNFNALLNKNTPHWSHPLSRVFTDIMRTFPDLHTLPEQVAVVYIMFLVMRFEVEPTRENLELLPEWCRPLPSQIRTAHPCWFDYLPW